MPTEKKEELQILLTVEEDVRADLQLPLDPFPHSIPHHDESGNRERWAIEAYDRTFSRMWGY